MKLNLQCVVNDRSLGVWGRHTLAQLIEQGIDVSFFPLYPIQTFNNDPYIPYYNQGQWRQPLCDYKAPSLLIWHPNNLAYTIGRGPKIAWTIFELDTLKPEEIHNMSQQDLVLVPSKWAKQVCEQHLKNRVEVVPLGVDTSIFKPTNRYVDNACFGYSGNTTDTTKTNFFFCGKIEKRKGIDVLHHIFRRAFRPHDEVHLYISWHNPFLTPRETEVLQNTYHKVLGEQVTFLPWYATQQQLASYMAEMDCGIFPTRAEGWCFPAMEMMACGKQIIITNYSGQTEFCHGGNAFLVRPGKNEPAVDHKWFHGEGGWSSINDEQIELFVNHMQIIHKAKQDGENLYNSYGVETAQEYSWANSILKLKEILLEYDM